MIGPISKQEYLDRVNYINLDKVFIGSSDGLFYDFRIDPYMPSMVWFVSGFSAVHTGGQNHPLWGNPTEKLVCCPPQSLSLTFDEHRKVTHFAAG